jgi:hypothetical protein
MYDRDCLYVGGRLKDPTPMMNQYRFGGQVNAAWNADALQVGVNNDVPTESRLHPNGWGVIVME